MLREIGEGRCRNSRGKSNPRGVKRVLNRYRVRRRSEPINQRYRSTPVLIQ